MNDVSSDASADRAVEFAQGLSLKDIYNHALDTRNMEIELFWKRCNYFLVLNSGLALAYFNVTQEVLQIPAAILGVVVSSLWLQVALGSKFWQERWEDCLRSVEFELIANEQFGSKHLLFSLESDKVSRLVKDSLGRGEHSGLYGLLDGLIEVKPSVTAAMMYLVLTFLASWLLLLGHRVFTAFSLPPI